MIGSYWLLGSGSVVQVTDVTTLSTGVAYKVEKVAALTSRGEIRRAWNTQPEWWKYDLFWSCMRGYRKESLPIDFPQQLEAMNQRRTERAKQCQQS